LRITITADEDVFVRTIDEASMAFVRDRYGEEDNLFLAMREHHLFKNRQRWCDMTPSLLRVLIAETLAKFVVDPEAEYIGASLDFLIGMFAHVVAMSSDAEIDAIAIDRRGHTEVTYAISLTERVNLPSPKRPGLRLIVDNTAK